MGRHIEVWSQIIRTDGTVEPVKLKAAYDSDPEINRRLQQQTGGTVTLDSTQQEGSDPHEG